MSRYGRRWGSASTAGRSSTPSEPGWPRPCPSPRHLHGSASTASSSPRRYEEERLGSVPSEKPPPPAAPPLTTTTTGCRLRRRSRAVFVVVVFCHITGETLKHFPSWGRAAEPHRRLGRCPTAGQGTLRQAFRRKWTGGRGWRRQTLGSRRLEDQMRLETKSLDVRDLEPGCECTALYILHVGLPVKLASLFSLAHFFFFVFQSLLKHQCNSELVPLDRTELDSNPADTEIRP